MSHHNPSPRYILSFFFLSVWALPLTAQVGRVGINTTTPAAVLHVADSSVLFTGPATLPATPGPPPVSGSGTRMMWYVDKAAFRAGRVNGTQWDIDSVGVLSVALGENIKATGFNSFAGGGAFNKASGLSSFVGGGGSNVASGSQDFIGGGLQNIASGGSSFVGGGNDNTATGVNSFGGGGAFGIAFGGRAFVGGGTGNQALELGSAVAGGENNTASGEQSFVGGGVSNAASGVNSFIGGGAGNTVSGFNAFAGGGSSNTVTTGLAFAGGGGSNTVSGFRGFVGGGFSNTASADNAFVGGGRDHVASNEGSFIGGGELHTASGFRSFLGGGGANTASGDNSFVGGGAANEASGLNSFVAGGAFNEGSGSGSFVGGGNGNLASEIGAFVGGGASNLASGESSFAAGHFLFSRSFGEAVVGIFSTDYTPVSTSAFNANDRLFVIGNGSGASSRSNAVTVLKNGNVGINTSTPSTRIQIVASESSTAGPILSFGGTVPNQVESGRIRFLEGAPGTNWRGAYVHYDGAANLMHLGVHSADNQNLADDINILTIDRFGQEVGIGTIAPSFQLHLSSNSAGKPTSNVWSVASDGRLKRNVHDYTDGLAALMKIHPVWFTYTGEANLPEDTGVGVIAQELQQIAPYMVGTWTHESGGQKSEYLSVDNGAMTYMLINAVKEQQAIIEELKRTIETLSAEVAEVKARGAR